jgi:hypothetical protein
LKVNVQIERLILDGVHIPPRERPLLKAAVEGELSRLLAVDGLKKELTAGGAMPSLSAAPVQLANNNDPERFGQEIAQAVYKGIGQ